MSLLQKFHDADLSAFFDAGEACRKAAEDLNDHAEDFRGKVVRQLEDTSEGGVWSGDAPEAAQRPMDDLRAGMRGAAEQLGSVPKLLERFVDEAGDLQRKLRSTVADAREQGMEVDLATGQVTSPESIPGLGPAATVAAEMQRYVEEFEQLDADISGEIAEALAVDISAEVVGGDIDRAVELGEGLAEQLGEDLSRLDAADQQKVAELAGLLAERGDNPVFAQRVFDRLGGSGTVELLASLTNEVEDSRANDWGDAEQVDQLDGLRTQLGRALGSASSELDGDWVSGFTDAGREQFDVSYSLGSNVYGYQLMGPLLEEGDYDADFLTTVGEDMLAFEQENPGVFDHPERSGAMGNTSSIDEVPSVRFDPVDSLMVPMAENAEAGREFFDPGSNSDRIGYMLDREFDTHGGETVLDGNRQARVLDALATASDGEEVDDAGPGFEIAAETINHVGAGDPAGSNLQGEQARQSMGRLVEGQLPQVNEALTKTPDDLSRLLEADSRLYQVLHDVGRSPEAYASLYESQMALTAAEMYGAASNKDVDVGMRLGNMEEAGTHTGMMMGHLDYAQTQAIQDGWVAAEDEYNRRLELGGKLGGAALSETVGRLPGGEFSRVALDEIIDHAKVDYSDEAAADVSEVHEKTREELGEMSRAVIWEQQLFEGERPPPEELFDANGNPIPEAEMTDEEHSTLVEWSQADDSGYPAGTINGIQGEYSDGKDIAAEDQGAG